MKNRLYLILITCSLCIFYFFNSFASPTPTLYSEGAILIESKSGSILYQKNAHEKLYPASTTKVLTCALLLENIDPSSPVAKTASSIQNVPSDSSHIGLKKGDTYSALDGIYAILLGSDNYVAYDMALKSSGSISAFANKMNAKAKEIGALNTHFVNPHGYHDPNHYTTPYDLAKITQYAFSNPLLENIAGTYQYNLKVINREHVIPVKNTSLLIDTQSKYYNPNVLASKTGYHTPAKRTLTAKAKYPNIELIAVVMKADSPNQYEDIKALFDYGSKNFDAHYTENSLSENDVVIVNKTYLPEFEKYVTFALEKGWIEPSVRNYCDPITTKEFLDLLDKSIPEQYASSILNKFMQNGSSIIYKGNTFIKRKDAAVILEDLSKSLHLTPVILTPQPYIPDNYSQDTNYGKAIEYVVKARILGEKNALFHPEKSLTYQEALSITHRIHNLFYNSFPYIFMNISEKN